MEVAMLREGLDCRILVVLRIKIVLGRLRIVSWFSVNVLEIWLKLRRK